MFDEYQYDRALACYNRGQIDQAIDLLKPLLAEDPNQVHLHALLALCLLSKKRLYAAEYEVQLALSIDAQEPLCYSILARIYFLKNKMSQALENCDESLRLNPNYSDSLLLKSEIYSVLGETQKSLQCLNEAAKIEPDSIDISLAYGHYYFYKGDSEQALMYASEAMQKDPQNSEAAVLLGKIKLKQGDVDEALQLAKFSILNNPDSSEALKLFCDIKVRQNWFLGLWWRINSKLSSLSGTKASIVLIAFFLLFNLLSQLMEDLGYLGLSKVFSYGWLLLVVYSWVGLPMYQRKLQKELSQFRFNDDY